MNGKRSARIFLVLLALFTVYAWSAVRAEDADSAQDAKLLFQEALRLKKAGKAEEAVQSFEKAIRMNRSVLSEDDQGLVKDLEEGYRKKLASAPEDVTALEGLAFVSAVCKSDFPKAIELYTKVQSLAKDETVKARTAQLLERLKAQQETGGASVDDPAGKGREERIKAWAEMEKHDKLAAQADVKAKKEERIQELYTSRDEMEARIPQLEDEIKGLEEEAARAERMYLTTQDRSYKWKENRRAGELKTKQGELERLKSDISKTLKEIEKLNKDMDSAEGTGSGSASDTSGITLPPEGGPPGENPLPDGSGSLGGPASGTGDQPPYDNPDFPKNP